jgi:hypothetical protein
VSAANIDGLRKTTLLAEQNYHVTDAVSSLKTSYWHICKAAVTSTNAFHSCDLSYDYVISCRIIIEMLL